MLYTVKSIEVPCFFCAQAAIKSPRQRRLQSQSCAALFEQLCERLHREQLAYSVLHTHLTTRFLKL